LPSFRQDLILSFLIANINLSVSAERAGSRPVTGHTGKVSVLNIDGAREALRAGKPEELLGLAECGWLDVKEGVYRLDEPGRGEELAKDVAAFANSRIGGLLLVGYRTRKEHEVEVIDEIRPVPRAVVDLDRHRKLIRERVIPSPREVRVDWIDRGDGKGIVVIDVPAQPPARLPHVVAAPSRTSDPSRFSVAVPVREGDATAWLPQSEIQRLLSAGWRETGGPSDEFLSGLIERAVTAARRDSPAPAQKIGIGDGEPGWKGPFQQAWNELTSRGLWIGDPASTVYWDGPGVVQHFDAPHVASGWVLCALPHHRPVAVDGETWQALQRAGAGAPSGDALEVIGYPVPAPQETRVADRSATSIDLTGGAWGNGNLIRDPGSGEWRWEPAVDFSMNMTRAARNWTGGKTQQLLWMRAVATLPWAAAGDLTITPERRRELEQQLPASRLAGLVTTLSRHRGADLRAADWKRGPNPNASDWLSCSTAISTADGRHALQAEVMIALPNATDSSVVTWGEAIEHKGARLRDDLRLSVGDVVEFLTVAWQTATEILPRVVTDNPGAMTWAGPPAVNLRLEAEDRYDNVPHPIPTLDDYVDLTPLGQSDRGQLREMSVTVTAPLQLDDAARRRLTSEAILYTARQFGFLDAPADLL
jgi:hypothetical protein